MNGAGEKRKLLGKEVWVSWLVIYMLIVLGDKDLNLFKLSTQKKIKLINNNKISPSIKNLILYDTKLFIMILSAASL